MANAGRPERNTRQTTRLQFGSCVVEQPACPGDVKDKGHEYVYCLYDTDNDVTMYETCRDALQGKRCIERLVDAVGPFRMPRHELPLVRASARALRYLELSEPTRSGSRATELADIVAELRGSLSRVFPFRSICLSDGSVYRIKAKASDDSRK